MYYSNDWKDYDESGEFSIIDLKLVYKIHNQRKDDGKFSFIFTKSTP